MTAAIPTAARLRDVMRRPGWMPSWRPRRTTSSTHVVLGGMGFHVEDELLITDGGFDLLSVGTPNERLIELGEGG